MCSNKAWTYGLLLHGKDYRLSSDPSSLSSEDRDELARLCDETISTYLQKRGTAVYDAGGTAANVGVNFRLFYLPPT